MLFLKLRKYVLVSICFFLNKYCFELKREKKNRRAVQSTVPRKNSYRAQCPRETVKSTVSPEGLGRAQLKRGAVKYKKKKQKCIVEHSAILGQNTDPQRTVQRVSASDERDRLFPGRGRPYIII